MTTLSQAPLIEAIFELRWGEMLQNPESSDFIFKFSLNDKEFFAGQFKQLVFAEGFTTIEEANPGMGNNPLPHVIEHRFRKSPGVWPCYQIGLGVFAVNQVNDGYSGSAFREQISNGLKMLDSAQPEGIEGLPGIGVELRYQDGFVLEDDESATDFLKKKMEIDFSLPEEFLESDNIESNLQGNMIAFNLDVKSPVGVLLVSIEQAFINGKSGFVMTTTMRSADNNKPEFTLAKLEEWVASAHNVQKHAFKTLISKRYARSFE